MSIQLLLRHLTECLWKCHTRGGAGGKVLLSYLNMVQALSSNSIIPQIGPPSAAEKK